MLSLQARLRLATPCDCKKLQGVVVELRTCWEVSSTCRARAEEAAVAAGLLLPAGEDTTKSHAEFILKPGTLQGLSLSSSSLTHPHPQRRAKPTQNKTQLL